MVERRNDEYGVLHASGIHVAGRIVLNLWRLLRSELKLRIYTLEACVAAVLQLRTPHTPAWVLSQWFQAGPAGVNLFVSSKRCSRCSAGGASQWTFLGKHNHFLTAVLQPDVRSAAFR